MHCKKIQKLQLPPTLVPTKDYQWTNLGDLKFQSSTLNESKVMSKHDTNSQVDTEYDFIIDLDLKTITYILYFKLTFTFALLMTLVSDLDIDLNIDLVFDLPLTLSFMLILPDKLLLTLNLRP